jgi:hypothetical protein
MDRYEPGNRKLINNKIIKTISISVSVLMELIYLRFNFSVLMELIYLHFNFSVLMELTVYIRQSTRKQQLP